MIIKHNEKKFYPPAFAHHLTEIDARSIKNYFYELRSKKLIVEGVDYYVNHNYYYFYSMELINKFIEMKQKKKQKMLDLYESWRSPVNKKNKEPQENDRRNT